MIVLALAAAVAAAQPGRLHTHKDWIVGCDNVRACQANALAPGVAEDDYLELTVSRGALPGDRATLFVPLPDGGRKGARLSLRVDGANIITFTVREKDSASLPLTGPLLAAFRNGRQVTLLDAGGKALGGASLAGLAAALRYIDDQQGRVGTASALVAIGAKPDTRTPPPAPPLIVVPPASSKPPRSLSVAVATRLIGADNATCDYATAKVKPQAYRLDAAHSLVLVDHPCGNGAYNLFTSVYVVDEAGGVRPARFDLPPAMGEPSTDETGELTNGGWDPRTGRLDSYEKGRGLGDCGTTEAYAWDGARFRLVEAREMDECRGSVDYIRTWIARTSR
jgi:hypothetical protein